ncbi:MAG: ATP-binding cassette domain-containing protein, partial [Burkholderiaceae bacterium]
MTDTQPLFRIRKLSKVYQTGDVQIHALRELDLDVSTGEFIVLLGASGSGKSTLLNIMGGLDSPTSGSVMVGDLDLSAADSA